MAMIEEFDIVVIGGGPAGMAAALAADSYVQTDQSSSSSTRSFDSKLKTHSLKLSARIAVIERAPELGGILNQCTHPGFGLTYFGEELTGQEYAGRFEDRIYMSGVEVFTDTTVLDVSGDRALTITGKKTGLARLRAKAVILASGCRERPIGSLPVAGTRPSGVYSAGMAQKMMNLGGYDLGSRFIILGSGDVGMIVARHLAQTGKEVIAVIEKEAVCGGLPRNRINCLEKYNIPLLTNTTVSRVHGIGRVSGVTVDSRFMECDTLITSVGLIPERELLDSMIGIAGGTGASSAQSVAYGYDSEPERGLPEWLFLCGNACYVHDVVDDVTVESQRAGEFAAEYVLLGKIQTPELSISDAAEDHLLQDTHHDPDNAVLCIACPKGCKAFLTAGGWQGLACGRAEPTNAL